MAFSPSTAFARVELRSEAHHLELAALTESQRDALRSIGGALREAVNASTGNFSARMSRLLLLNGDRGAGKTSVVATAIDETGGTGSDSGHGKDAPGGLGALRKELAELRGQVLWLDILSLDPLPDGTNCWGRCSRASSATHRRASASAPTPTSRGCWTRSDVSIRRATSWSSCAPRR